MSADPAPDANFSPDEFVPPKPIIPIVVVVLLLVGGGAAAWYYGTQQSWASNRIIVAIETQTVDDSGEKQVGRWWGARGKHSGKIVDAWSKELERMGMDVVSAGHPDLDPILDEGVGGPDDIVAMVAPAMSAPFVLTGALALVEQRPMPETDRKEYVFEVTLTLHAVDSGDTVAVLDAPDRFVAIGRDVDQAFSNVIHNVSQRHLVRVGVALAGQPMLRRLKETPADKLRRDDLRVSGELDHLWFVARQNETVRKRRADAEAEAPDLEKARRVSPDRRLGPYLGEEFMVGPAVGGQVLLLTEHRVVEVYPNANDYSIRAASERLVLASPDGKERKTLLETYNVYSFPSISLDGKTVAVVLDHYGWSSSLVTVSVPDGKVTSLLSHADHDFSSPRVSPNGSKVAFWRRTCRRCDASLELIDVASKTRRRLLEPDGLSKTVPWWSPDDKTLYLAVFEDGVGSVFAVDVATGDKRPLLGPAVEPPAVDEDGDASADQARAKKGANSNDGNDGDATDGDDYNASSFDDPAISPDGKLLAVAETDPMGKRHVGLLDLATMAYKRLAPGRASRLEFSPDSSKIAAETRDTKSPHDPSPWDTEIAVADVATGDAWVVTYNGMRDDLGGWSPDSKWIYHQQREQDPDGDTWDYRVYWAPAAKPTFD